MLYGRNIMVVTKALNRFRDDCPAEASGTEKANPNP